MEKTLFYTNNCGASWKIKSCSDTVSSYDPKDNPNAVGNLSLWGYGCNFFKMFPNGAGYLNMQNTYFIKTLDGGVNFNWPISINSPEFLNIFAMDMTTDKIGCICRHTPDFSTFGIYSTTNGGKSWKLIIYIDKIASQIGIK
jgi:hypothetical protein